MTWFKLYSEFRDDPKILSLDDHAQIVFIRMLCMASESEERGVIRPYPRSGLAMCLHTTEERLSQLIELFSSPAYNMISLRDDGAIVITHWEKRNRRKPSDEPEAVQERVQKTRQRRQTHETGDSANDDVTRYTDEPDADVTRYAGDTDDDVTRYAGDTDDDVTRYAGDTDDDVTPMKRPIEIRDIRDKSSPLLSPLQQTQFDLFWHAYPSQQRARPAEARKAFAAALADGVDPQQLIAAAQHYAEAVKDEPPKYVKFPGNFIRDGVWEEYVNGVPEQQARASPQKPKAEACGGPYIPGVEETRQLLARAEAKRLRILAEAERKQREGG